MASPETSCSVRDDLCDGPQQPGSRNSLTIVFNRVEEQEKTAAKKQEKADGATPSKKAKRLQFNWRHPDLLPVNTAFLSAVARDHIYTSQANHGKQKVKLETWFDTTAKVLNDRFKSLLHSCSNMKPGEPAILTGSQLRAYLTRIMAAWAANQAASVGQAYLPPCAYQLSNLLQVVASGTEEVKYVAQARELVIAIEQAFEEYKYHKQVVSLALGFGF
jgi:hypothetical protein